MRRVYPPEPKETDDYSEGTQEAYILLNDLLCNHRSLQYLQAFEFKILFAKKSMKAKGRTLIGKAIKHTKKDRMYHPFTFTIMLDFEYWNLHPEKQSALLYHELCHCGVDENYRPILVPHDLEEFYSVIAHYGDWQGEVERFNQQLNGYFERCRANNKGLIETQHKPVLRLIGEEDQP